ncbi:hypothetical protein [Sphingopyxis sp. BSNA05]|uniref:ribbon-helix-helix domain-containing protein n=1 Tax=Sphingopyxis sp. BSNA05 TaxID=1236614 RepID=UPI0020B676E8|nr:hypothetical protein [Sphingopyxis sp. BSNA05]
MATVRKTITLSASQDAWIKSRIAGGAFTNDSEYIRDLVKRDQSQEDRLATLRAAIARDSTAAPATSRWTIYGAPPKTALPMADLRLSSAPQVIWPK